MGCLAIIVAVSACTPSPVAQSGFAFTIVSLDRVCDTGFDGKCPTITSVSMWDFDQDGDYDRPGYRNVGGMTFEALPDSAWQSLSQSRAAAFADLDGDGDTDLYYTGYSEDSDSDDPDALWSGESRPLLNIDGAFIRADLGLARPDGRGKNILPGDCDGDDDLDLFVQWADDDGAGQNWETDKAHLFVNDGSGRFEDKAEGSSLSLEGSLIRPEGGSNVDLNGDGYLDIVTASRLFLGTGQCSYVDATAQWGLSPFQDRGLNLTDIDQDGDFDIIMVGYEAFRVLRHEGSHFVDATADVGLAGRATPSVVNVGDYDNDGDEDLTYVEMGARDINRSRTILMANENGVFMPMAHYEFRGATNAPVDLDLDGRLDLLVDHALLHNLTPQIAKAMRVRVLGEGGLDTAHGSTIHAISHDGRHQLRHMGNMSWKSQGMQDIHLAVPDEGLASLTITWPGGQHGAAQSVEVPREVLEARPVDDASPLLTVWKDGFAAWQS